MNHKIIQGEPLGPRVSSVSPMEDFKLLLAFDNGDKRVFDVKPLFSMDAFLPLKSKRLFESVKVAYGSILWPDGIDYCPDTLYAESTPYVIDHWNDIEEVEPDEIDLEMLAEMESNPGCNEYISSNAIDEKMPDLVRSE